MDRDYFAARERYALHMAIISPSMSARIAHAAFAKAYGLILAAGRIPAKGPKRPQDVIRKANDAA